ncbi:MAG: DUF5047 domain-containing protein [Ilumatobacteraceae bacterium]
MRTRTARWDTTVVRPHRVTVDATVYYNRQPVAGIMPLAIVAGTATFDRGAAQLARLDSTFAEPLLVPQHQSVLSPFGYEIAIRRGIVYTDGTTEMMPLGVFPIQSSTADGLTLVTQISALDRSQLVKDARLEDAYQIVAGVNYATAIQNLIGAGVDGLTYQFAPVPFATPLLTFPAQADRWDAAQGMAKSCGFELFFDGTGTLVLRPEPTFTAPVWTVAEGPDGVLVAASLAQDRGPAYNRVIATGENSSIGTIPRGVWTDAAAASPSRYSSGFGRKPRFYSSPFITTDGQAQSAANAIGASVAGVARSLSFSAIPNPALETGDPILVRRTALGIDEVHLIDSLTFDLTATGAMTARSRALVT